MLLRLRSHGWLLGVLAIASFTMLFRLGAQPIQNWDEGIHGAVSLDMVERGDWVVPWYAGGPYFRKPPLKLWLSAGLFEVFGVTAWTLRLPNAVAGIVMVLLVAWWMWEWRRSRTEAFLAGLIVATMRPIFLHGFRTGEMDGLLTLFVTATLYCWWKAADGGRRTADDRAVNRWLALCGAAIGLAVMTKSAAGLLPLSIIMTHALVSGVWRRLRLRDVSVSALVFASIAAPWHLAVTMRHGAPFWTDYIGWHVVKRTTEAIHNATAGTWWYLPTLMQKFSPYAWWLLPALLSSLSPLLRKQENEGAAAGSGGLPAGREAKGAGTVRTEGEGATERFERVPIAGRDERPRTGGYPTSAARHARTETLLLTWFLVTFTLFTIARTKFAWYLLPLYPAAAMLLVPFLTAARDVARNRTTAILHLTALAIAILALPSLYPDDSILDRILDRMYAPFGHPFVAAALAITVAVVAYAFLRHRLTPEKLGRVAITIVLALMLIPALAVTARHLIRTEPPGPFPAIAAAVTGTGGHLVSFGMDLKQHPAGYFILRAALAGDVRVLDGRRRDVPRTLGMLRERTHGFLLTEAGTELPVELRAAVGEPEAFGTFELRRRR